LVSLDLNDRRILGLILIIVVLPSGYLVWDIFFRVKEGIDVGFMASDFTATNPDGEVFVLSEHLGELVVIDFMDVWCLGCRWQLEEIRTLYQNVEGFTLVSVEITPTLRTETFRNWIAKNDFLWFVGSSPESAWTYEVIEIPTIVAVDQEGIIRYRGKLTTYETLRNLLIQYK
jgi:peroxiredoxin